MEKKRRGTSLLANLHGRGGVETADISRANAIGASVGQLLALHHQSTPSSAFASAGLYRTSTWRRRRTDDGPSRLVEEDGSLVQNKVSWCPPAGKSAVRSDRRPRYSPPAPRSASHLRSDIGCSTRAHLPVHHERYSLCRAKSRKSSHLTSNRHIKIIWWCSFLFHAPNTNV
jgi:hypothetical protein